MMRTKLLPLLCILLFPFLLFGGYFLFGERHYALLSLATAILALVPLFLHFEKNCGNTKRLVLLSAFLALSIAGRIAFAALPFFKPVTATVVFCGIFLGWESGFVCGGLSALLSNLYFGQGPWTPFQMLAWGFVGLIAGMLAHPLKKSRLALIIYAVFSGIAYSMLMDAWVVLWQENGFSLSRYLAYLASAIPVTLIYAVSNTVFLLLLMPFMKKTLERLITKYGLQ